MTVRIERLTLDDEPRRRFFLLAEVTFADEGNDNYHSDDEAPDVAAMWMRDGLEDRDDSPHVKFHSIPGILDVDVRAIAEGEYPGHGARCF